MKQLGKLIPLFLLCLGLLGCNNDPFLEEQNGMGNGGNATIKEISVTLPKIPSDVVTRTEFKMSNTKVTSSWVENDTIGIFPQKGDQVSFPILEGAGTNTAIFDGGDWGLKTGHSYAAYYPFNRTNFFRNNKTIPMDYTGQTQEGNGNAAHLGAYDYLATGQVSPNSSGSLNLEMQRLGSLVMLELVVPKSETYTSLTLISSEAKFITKAELDISGPEPQIIEKETGSTITLSLKDITLEANDTLRAYLMCSPVDLSSSTLSVVLNGEATYTTELEPKKLEAGTPYKFIGSYVPPVNFIEFADPLVKQICVNKWDTNNDGELSYVEASVVTEIPSALFQNMTITSFDELLFFTNLNVIGFDAFNGCGSLASITIPSGVTSIEFAAFYGCRSLTSITIPSGVTSIGDGAFYECTSLTGINIPEGVTKIGAIAFYGCRSLTSITLPSGVTSIGRSAFSGCSSLTNINIPEGVTKVEAYVFQNCSSLTSINIPSGVSEIEIYAFDGCRSLTSITIPEGVTSIGTSAFYECSNLTSINIPSGVTSIGTAAFYECSNLTSINIPSGVTSIGTAAFAYCSNLTSIICIATIPPVISSNVFNETNECPIYVPASSVETYKTTSGWSTYAHRIQPIFNIEFADSLVKQICVNKWDTNNDGELSYVEASAVTEIPRALFRNKAITSFDELRYFTNLNVIKEQAFSNCDNLTSITLPDVVTSIESQAFYYCSSLMSITLPGKVTSIANYAFSFM